MLVCETETEREIEMVLQITLWVRQRSRRTTDKEGTFSCFFPAELKTNCPSITRGGSFSIV